MLFENMILITDVDGTLLTDDKKILEKDMTAIREFTENGGLFSIATGRGVTLSQPIIKELKLYAPTVILNGAAVYHFGENRYLWQKCLPAVATDYLTLITEQFPSLGVEVLREKDVYVPKTNKVEEEHLKMGVNNPVRCSLTDIPKDNWLKLLFADQPPIIDQVTNFVNKHCANEVHLVRSSPIFYEILPLGVNKGTGLQKMLELTKKSESYVVAVGDYANDIEMLEYADLGVAVANAVNEVTAASDITVCDNNNGALWETVQHLKTLSNKDT